MAIARTFAVALTGVTGQLIEVQADLSAGLPGLSITGRADVSVMEARDRIRAAVLNSHADWPNRRVTVALLPADVRKVGSGFDLALALAVLAAAGQVPLPSVADTVWMAELGLDGRLRPVRGVLPAVMTARQAGATRVVVAEANVAEASLVGDLDVRCAADLSEVVRWLRGATPPPALPMCRQPEPGRSGADLADVAGQVVAKRALEVAAAGGHHLYLVGTPGAGKTMLAERLPGLLPDLDDDAALEVTAVHSVAGALPAVAQLVRRAPFQAPHHTASVAAMVGGGSGVAGPGAISLAHRGVLFLDEAPEFHPSALDGLRQPLESGRVVLHRRGGAVAYPARFLLVLAANPCPCGRRAQECACAPYARRRYQQRISGPLLDRLDLRIAVDAVPHAALLADPVQRETSAQVAARVAAGRAAAGARWRGEEWRTNADVPGSVLRTGPLRLSPTALSAAQRQLERGELSARGFDRVLRLSWTVADLNGHVMPDRDDVAEAIYFRTGATGSWAA